MENLVDKISDDYLHKMTRKPNKSNVIHKINIILFVLRSGLPWKYLNKMENKYCESTYRKFFYQLCKDKTLDNLFDTKRQQYNSEITFIDTTNIRNKHGVKESIGFCPQDKKHKGNKLSLVVNDKGVPIGCNVNKASCHDLNMFEDTVKDINTKMIVGDKGYTSNKLKVKYGNKGIKILCPYKKNSKCTNNHEEKKILKRRHIVENSFSNLKKMKRIDSRYEIKISYFIGFIKLGLLVMMFR